MSLKAVYDRIPMPDERELLERVQVAFNHQDERLGGLILHTFDGEEHRERFLCMNLTAMEDLARYLKEECARHRNGETIPHQGIIN